MSDGPDIETRLQIHETRLDALSDALDIVEEENADLRSENERLRERVSELEARVTPNPQSKEYSELSRDEKVQQLRESLIEKASTRKNGRFAMEYKDVMWFFDGHPSAGHCYRLMELAGEADGFTYKELDDRSNQIRVNIDGVNDNALFHAVNKAPEGARL